MTERKSYFMSLQGWRRFINISPTASGFCASPADAQRISYKKPRNYCVCLHSCLQRARCDKFDEQESTRTRHNSQCRMEKFLLASELFSQALPVVVSKQFSTHFHSQNKLFPPVILLPSRKINFHVHDEWKKEENQIQLVNGSTGEISYKKACGRNGGESVPGFELRKCLQRLFSPFFSCCLVFPPRRESLGGFWGGVGLNHGNLREMLAEAQEASRKSSQRNLGKISKNAELIYEMFGCEVSIVRKFNFDTNKWTF